MEPLPLLSQCLNNSSNIVGAKMPPSSTNRTSRSTSSSRSDLNAWGNLREHELSLNLCSPENGHWGIMIYRTGERGGHLYHTRFDETIDPDKFFFEHRVQNIESQPTYGRSIVGHFSESERQRVEAALHGYGNTETHLPRRSTNTNCQNFVIGAYQRLEDDGLLEVGTADYFRRFHGCRGEDIGRVLVQDGRSWIPCDQERRSSPVDARYHAPTEEERRPTGRIDMARFEETFVGAVARKDAPPFTAEAHSSSSHTHPCPSPKS